MQREQVFKLFHLVDDFAENTPEKVFMITKHLQNLKNFHKLGQISLRGVIGPQRNVCEFLNEAMAQNQSVSYKNKLTLQDSKQRQKACLLLVLKQSGKGNIGFLVLITSDSFYHEKPIDRQSILYLLVRFIGDLASNIILLYDEIMIKDFKKEGSPFRFISQGALQFQQVQRKLQHVKIKDVEYDFSPLFRFDENYPKRINFEATSPVKSIIYATRSESEEFHQRQIKQMKLLKERLWNIVFFDKNENAYKILSTLELQANQQNQEKMEEIVQTYKKITKNIFQFSIGVFEESLLRFFKKKKQSIELRKEYANRMQELCLQSHIYLDSEHSQIQIKNHDQFLQKVSSELVREAQLQSYEPIDKNQLKQLVSEVIDQNWEKLWPDIHPKFTQFLKISNHFGKLRHSEPAFEFILFPFQTSYSREQQIQRVSYSQKKSISLTATKLQDMAKINDLSLIKNFQIYQLNNKRNSKLIWLDLRVTQSNLNYSVLFTYQENNGKVRHLRSFQCQSHFMFSENKQKCYVLIPSQTKLIHFEISPGESLQKITQINYCSPKQSSTRKKVICSSVSTSPLQKLFYLTAERNILYCFDPVKNEEILYAHRQGNSKPYLTPSHLPVYQYIRTFNEDMLIILGNKKFLDIYHPTKNGELQSWKSFQLNDDFMGATIFTDKKQNQFLLLHYLNQKKYGGCNILENLQATEMLNKNRNQRKVEGNPIIDIFYWAYKKFGEYQTYTIREARQNKQLNIFHCSNIEQGHLKSYTQQVKFPGHNHRFLSLSELLRLDPSEKIGFESLMFEIESRIPLQLCTLQNGNIIPLNDGKQQNLSYQRDGASRNIYEICKRITFGAIEDILQKNSSQKITVVSIMGAQSSGKSYLLNRLFGTRFTVSSCRTTIGIWISLIRKSDGLYLVMDCEGLFSQNRTSQEEEKLVKILASLSDFTILNQNMSMNNRGYSKLMTSIEQSTKHFEAQSKRSKRYYKGSLMMVVRDVDNSQIQTINKEFHNQYKMQTHKNKNNYLKKLFEGRVYLHCLPHFEKEMFPQSIKGVLDVFEDPSKQLNRGVRDVLKSLKLRLAELSHDDSNLNRNSDEYDLEEAKNEVLLAWFYGKQVKTFVSSIDGISFSFDQDFISMTGFNDTNCLEFFEGRFNKQIIQNKRLNTANFNQYYRAFNDMVRSFFKERLAVVDRKIKEEFKMPHIEKNKLDKEQATLMEKIRSQNENMKLCMRQCPNPQCKLLCIKKHGHRDDLQLQINDIDQRIKAQEVIQQNSQLTDKQKEINARGLQKQLLKSTEDAQKLKVLQTNTQNYQSFIEKIRELQDEIDKLESQRKSKSLSEQKQEELVRVLKWKIEISQIESQRHAKLLLSTETIRRQQSEKSLDHLSENISSMQAIFNQLTQEKQKISIQISDKKTRQKQYKASLEKLEKDIKQKRQSIEKATLSKNEQQEAIEACKKQIQIKTSELDKVKHSHQSENQTLAQLRQKLENDKQNLIIKKNFIQSLQKQTKDLQNKIQKLQQQRQQGNANLLVIERLCELILEVRKIKLRLKQAERKKKFKEQIEGTLAAGLEEVKMNIEGDQSEIKKKIQDKINLQRKKAEMFAKKNPSKAQEIEKLISRCNILYSNAQELQKIQIQIGQFEGQQQIFEDKLRDITKHLEDHHVAMIIQVVSFDVQIDPSHYKHGKSNQLIKKIKSYLKQKKLSENLVSYFQQFYQEDLKERASRLTEASQQLSRKLEEAQNSEQQVDILGKMEDIQKELENIQWLEKFREFVLNDGGQDQTIQEVMKLKFLYMRYCQFYKTTEDDIYRELQSGSIPERLTQLQVQSKQKQKEIDEAQNEEELNSASEAHDAIKAQIQTLKKVKDQWDEICGKIEDYCRNIMAEKIKKKVQIQFDWSEMIITITGVITDGELTEANKLIERGPLEEAIQNGKVDPQLSKLIEWSPKYFQEFDKLLNKVSSELPQQQRNGFKQQKIKEMTEIAYEELTEQKYIEIFGGHIREEVKGLLKIKLGIQDQTSQALKKREQNLTNSINSEEQQIRKRQQICKLLNQQINQKSQNCANLSNMIRQLSQTITDLQQQIKARNHTSSNLTTKIATQESLCTQYSSQSSKLQHKLKDLQANLQNLKKKHDEYQRIVPNSYRKLLADVKSQVTANWTINQQIYQLQKQIQNKKKDRKQYIQEANKIKQEYKGVEEGLSAIKKKLERMNQYLTQLKTIKDKISKKNDSQKSIDQLNNSLQQKQAELEKLCECTYDHKCNLECENGCLDQYCSFSAGHQGPHLCPKPGHKCQANCSKPQCNRICSKQYDHPKSQDHNCNEIHACGKNCKYCGRPCMIQKDTDHQTHNCKAKKCPKKCILCNKQCSSEVHQHDDKTEEVTLKIWDQQQNAWKQVTKRLHLCNDQHFCNQICQSQGVCSVNYKEDERNWVKNGVVTQYSYRQQIQKTKPCTIKIPKGHYKHKEPCSCQQQHTCDVRCPDCKSLCSLPYGHPNKHDAQHRNQQCLKVASKNQDYVDNDSQYKFQVGEIIIANRCPQSCIKKGRSHYHLNQCKGGDKCLEKVLNGRALHSKESYFPYPQKKYDMVLCRDYWDFHKFQMPVKDKQQIQLFEQCNYACIQYKKHEDQKPVYCNQPAWHSFSTNPQQHTFSCSEDHRRERINKIQICFLIDVSNSMQQYIKGTKQAVEKIMESAKKSKIEVLVSIIGYRDHKNSSSDIVQNIKKMCLQKKQQLRLIQLADNDPLAQRKQESKFMLEVMEIESNYRSVNADERENKLQMFEKQKIFLKYHPPFYLDLSELEVSDNMTTIQQKADNAIKMALGEQGIETTLQQFLIGRIDKCLKNLQSEKNKEDEYKLLEVHPLASPQSALQFFQNLRSRGQEDFPEAVLDGMHQVVNLNWSNDTNTLRYVFHILDAPPHGRQYSQNKGDRFPNGCPCGLTHEVVVNKLSKLNLKYIMYPLQPLVNQCLELFAESGLEFQKKQMNREDDMDFEEMANHSSGMIIHQMQQRQNQVHDV